MSFEKKDIPRPNDSYFEHSFPSGNGSQAKGENAHPSVILSNDPPPGAVTFLVHKGDRNGQDGLQDIEKVNDLLSNPTTKLYKWDTEHYALTTVTPDQSTTALFFTRHLEDTGVLRQGATKGLESELARHDHLPGINQAVAETLPPEVAGDMAAAMKQVHQLHQSGGLTTVATNTTREHHDPASENLGGAAVAKSAVVKLG